MIERGFEDFRGTSLGRLGSGRGIKVGGRMVERGFEVLQGTFLRMLWGYLGEILEVMLGVAFEST